MRITATLAALRRSPHTGKLPGGEITILFLPTKKDSIPKSRGLGA